MKKYSYLNVLAFIIMSLIIFIASNVEVDVAEEVEEDITTLQPVIPQIYEQPVDNPVDNPVDIVDNVVESPLFTDEQLEILAIIIYQEAGGDNCSDDTRRKVGSVFLNRVNSQQFPNTFEEVATQRRQYGTLYWTGIKWPDRASTKQESHAVERAYVIAEELLTNGSILPENVIWQAEFTQGDGIYCYQDEIYFCYSEVNK